MKCKKCGISTNKIHIGQEAINGDEVIIHGKNLTLYWEGKKIVVYEEMRK